MRPKSAESLRWALSHHLLPFFAGHHLGEITVAEVDRYRTDKLIEERLSASSINKTLRLLGQIMDAAVERELVDRNPMWINRRRRYVRAASPNGTHLSRAVHIQALLDAAGELDQDAPHGHRSRRAMLATLVFAGLRISELLELRWTDVDTNAGRLTVRRGKTPAAAREIVLLAALTEELGMLRARRTRLAEQLVFEGTRGGRWTAENLRRRVLRPAVERANERLGAAGSATLPEPVTHHSLRRTYASLMFAIGCTPPEVMDALGHVDARTTLQIYARAMRREEDEVELLRCLTGVNE
ncbi:MAG: integrase family protein [Solirubrobacterales bacterium]|nr:integrase family protein [Solirubrobacterales bacterium]